MSEKKIVMHCAPTLAGMKTGNIFTCEYEEESTFFRKVRFVNKTLNKKGIYFTVLRYGNGKALIYAYRLKDLKRDLQKEEIRQFLMENGYSIGNVGIYLQQLRRRFKISSDFPHEIGVFLGYPIEDIRSFIENKGQNCQYSGNWKVYNNVDVAIRTFKKFKRCRDIYVKKQAEGYDVLKLAVGSH